MASLPPSSLQPDELVRYSRHILLPELGLAGQTRLKQARVLVVGAGGLGSPAALYLAAAGVGTLGLADFDRVEAHNLQRQIVHRHSSIGQPKLASALGTLREVNPYITLVPHPEGIQVHNALEIFRNYDVIVDGSDNFATRFLNNDAAVLARRPLVFGSIFKFEGQVSVFAPHLGGPCYRCLFPEPPPPGSVPTCGEAGVLGALCGVIGSLQALEALKLAAGFGEPLLGRLLTYDGLRQTVTTLRIPRDPECPACGAKPRIKNLNTEEYTQACITPPPPSMNRSVPAEIDVHETKRLLESRPQDTLLVDVREPHEREICQIAGAVAVPMRDIPQRLAELPKEKHLLIHCHHGGRSRRVMEYLVAQGYPRVTNVGGGIEAWALQIDPSLRRY